MLNRFRCLQARRVGLAPSASSKSLATKLPAFNDPPLATSSSVKSAGLSRLTSLATTKTNVVTASTRKSAKSTNIKGSDYANNKDADSANNKDTDSANNKDADSANNKDADNANTNDAKKDESRTEIPTSASHINAEDTTATESNAGTKRAFETSIVAASDSDSSQAQENADEDVRPNAISSQQFNCVFDLAMQTVSNRSADELCDVYLAPRTTNSMPKKMPKKAAGQQQTSQKADRIDNAEQTQIFNKKRPGCKGKASSSAAPKDETTVDSSSPKPPVVDFQFATGTWIECVDCKKWRHAADIAEPCRVPDGWRCADSPDPRQNSCELPELAEYFYAQGTNFALCNKYVAGSLVWARVPGFPYWPGLVEVDPDYGTFFELEAETNDVAAYHVTFLGRSASRAWIPDSRIRPFQGPADLLDLLPGLGKGAAPKAGSSAESKLRQLADEAASVVAELDFANRLKRYGYFGGQRVQLCSNQQPGKPLSRKPSAAKQKKANNKQASSRRVVLPPGKTKIAKPSKPTKRRKVDMDDRNEDMTAAEDADNGDGIGEQVGVNLLAARDRFRQRVSQLCRMRSCEAEDNGEDGEDANECVTTAED